MQKPSSLSRRQLICSEIIKILDYDIDIDVAMHKWWRNSLKGGGLRLSHEGMKVLFEIGYEFHEYESGLLSVPKTLLTLDHHLNCPYHITYPTKPIQKIKIFGNREAMMINLYGNFDKFLKSIS